MKLSFAKIGKHVSFVMFAASWAWTGVVVAHDGHSHASSSSSKNDSEPVERGRFQSDYVPLNVRVPHHGQTHKTQWQAFEVVYLPHETRVYVYDYNERPFTARGTSGTVIMQVKGNPEYFRNPLRYVAQPPGSKEQDYLAAQVDVTAIRDGDMRVYFDLVNLPYAQEKNLRFDQAFALTRGTLPVTVAQFTEADRPAVARQGTCPVMETGFDHGDPIKLLVGSQVIYVCCEDCIETIKKNPELYLEKTASLVQTQREEARSRNSQVGNVAPRCSKGCCKK